eukprot:431923_1
MHDSTFYLPYIEHYVTRSRRIGNHRHNVLPPPLSRANSPSFILLYTSHFLQTFGDRLWQFAVPLLFTELFVNTLFPQALFTFFTYLSVFLFMPLFGAWIDTTNRLYVVTTTIWIQNLCIVISVIIMFILGYYHDIIISHHSNIHNIDYKLILSFTGLLITSMIGQIMGNGATLSLEKDWVVVLCAAVSDSNTNPSNTNEKLLAKVNARMRRIDLFCKIMAPAFFGIYTEYLGNTRIQKVYYGSLVIFLWNVIGLVLEWVSIKLLYNENRTVLSLTNNRSKKAKKDNAFILIYNGWRSYIKSTVLLPSIAYCMLYINVLSGGVLVTSYLKFKGISYLILGVTKGFGALFGVFGTFLTPFLHNKLDLSMELIGIITIWLFWFALIPVGIADIIIGENNIILAYIMLACMIIARTGLWSFDLSINQLMQLMVKESVRAQVNGTQVALCQMFYMISSLLTMILHKVDQFFIVVWLTEILIFVACIVYSLWYLFYICKKNTLTSFDDTVSPLEQINSGNKNINNQTNR